MTVDVVIVAYRSRTHLPAAIASLGDGCIESVTVRDHFGDVADLHLRTPTGVVVAITSDPRNPGFGAGCNAGAQGGTADYILFLNPDAQMYSTALQEGVEFLDEDPGTVAVSGVIDGRDGTIERSAGRQILPVDLWGRAFRLKRLLTLAPIRALARRTVRFRDQAGHVTDDARAVETITAAALLVRRHAFERVGGFDEAFNLYAEDNDLSRRLSEHGVLVHLPVRWASHDNGSSFADAYERELQFWKGVGVYARKWWTPAARVSGAAAAATCLVPRSFQRSRWAATARIVYSWLGRA